MPSRVVALWLWYHGGAYSGYQTQPGYPTVQDSLMAALRRAGLSRNPVPAGRTDRGVHARMQVLSMRLLEPLTANEVASRINEGLPADIGVAACAEAAWKFHAGWAANGKTYRYRLGSVLPDSWRDCAWQVDCDGQVLAKTLELAVGTHDFAAFCEHRAPVRPRTIQSVSLHQSQGVTEVSLTGDGFGKYMVRGLVGAAVEVAKGALSASAFAQALAGQVRGGVGPIRAPPHGLTLWDVSYPQANDPLLSARLTDARVPARPPFISP